MVNDIVRLSAMVGYIFADEIDSVSYSELLYNKELATISEKAIKYSERSKRPLNECVAMKASEMKDGLILAKEHNMDDYTRGFIVGYILKSVFDESISIHSDLLDKIESEWDNSWFEKDGSQMNNYIELIRLNYRQVKYRRMGLITVQDLTRKCLELVNSGLKDKYIVFNKDRVDDIVRGIFNSNYADILNSDIVIEDSVDKHDIILLS